MGAGLAARLGLGWGCGRGGVVFFFSLVRLVARVPNMGGEGEGRGFGFGLVGGGGLLCPGFGVRGLLGPGLYSCLLIPVPLIQPQPAPPPPQLSVLGPWTTSLTPPKPPRPEADAA